MFNIITIIICLLFLIISLHNENKAINPISIFTAIWAIVLICSSLHLYNINITSDTTYFMIFLGTISYIAGYYLCKYNKYRIVLNKNSIPRNSINYELCYILLAISIVYQLGIFVTIYKAIGSLNLGLIQEYVRSDEYITVNSQLLNAIGILIIRPQTLLMPAVSAAAIVVDRKNSNKAKKLLLLTIAFELLQSFTTGGRTALMTIFIYIAFDGILILNRERLKNQYKKHKKLIRRIIIAAIIIFVVLSMLRSARALRNLYWDFAMSPQMLEKWCERVDDNRYYGYGLASLNGLIYPFLYLFKNIFGFDSLPAYFDKIFNLLQKTDTEWILIGSNNVRANAYVSMFFTFYLDFRWAGLIIGIFIFGWWISKAYKKATKDPNVKNLAFYCLASYSILFSFVRFQLMYSSYALALIYCYFVVFKPKAKAESTLMENNKSKLYTKTISNDFCNNNE